MSEPLAVVYYSNLIPGSRLASRLKDLGYRVRALRALTSLAKVCEEEKPLLALVEISPQKGGHPEITALRANPATQHIPVVAFSGVHDKAFQAAARAAGVSLLAASAAVLEQLPQLLDQALQVE
jgi:CheY-like chemotaxis protein